MNKKILILSVFLIALFACKRDDEISIGETNIKIGTATGANSNIPFAEESELKTFALDAHINDYNVVRKLAVIEMETDFKEQMNWHGTHLSERPVIIYDYDSKPKYYEFIVLDAQNTPIGTATALAKKEADVILTHVLPWVRDYSIASSKGSGYKIFKGMYPSSLYYGIAGKSGTEPNSLVDTEGNTITEIPLSDEAAQSIKEIEEMSDEEFEKTGYSDRTTAIAEIKLKNNELMANGADFWDVVDSIQTDLLALTDEQITTALNADKFWTSYDEYIIPAYNNNEALKRTRWDGWCGPSALAWIYRGLYTSYKGVNLPLHGANGFGKSAGASEFGGGRVSGTSSYYKFMAPVTANSLNKDLVRKQSTSIDNGLYADLAEATYMYSWYKLTGNANGPTYPFDLFRGLEKVTNGAYSMTAWPIWNSHEHIRRNALPAIVWCNWYSHYVVAFGSSYKYWNWQLVIKIFGWRKVVGSARVKIGEWHYATDNGNESKHNGYYPYWRNDYFTFTPKYGVYKK